MGKLSPHYKEDEVSGLDPGLQKYLDDEYFYKLKNILERLPKILVVFVGGNAVGKSTLADKLAEKYKALVLENDAVKQTILAKCPDIERSELNTLTWKYTMSLYERLPELTTNGFVVRDGVIQWYFDRILPIFEKNEYKVFVIHFDVSPKRARELIVTRGDTPTATSERLLTIMEDQAIHIKRFLSLYTPDVVLSQDDLYDYTDVINKLDDLIMKQLT